MTRCGTSEGTHRKGQVSPGMVAAVVDSAVVRPGQLSSGPRLLGNASPALAPGLSDHDWSVSEYISLPLHVSELDRVIYQEQCEVGQLSNVVDGDCQAAGCFLTPSTKTVPLTTSGRSVEPFNVRHFFDADSISL
jgi:hypothetical protein